MKPESQGITSKAISTRNKEDQQDKQKVLQTARKQVEERHCGGGACTLDWKPSSAKESKQPRSNS